MSGSDDVLRDRPDHGWQTDIVEAVLHTDVFTDPHSRALLVWLIDAALPHPLPSTDPDNRFTPLLRCVEFVRYCDRVPGGLRALATAIRLLEPDGTTARRVVELAREREALPHSSAALPSAFPGGSDAPAPRPDGRRDVFVSYTATDQRWAVWIAWELEEAGFSVLVQDWDFVPGSNWQLGVERGATECERVVAVLSPDYLESVYGRLEWQTAQGSDPVGFARRVVPVRIAPCRPRGLLAPLVFIDLVGLTVGQARTRLLGGMEDARTGRSKPAMPPGFPG